jgi:hypothetical protein
MFTRFEEYAATQMLGHPDSPPRSEGKLFFSEEWQRTVFGMALALSKEGRISPTACQGPCKQAPVALLRVGHGCELFAQFVRRREWEAVLDFAQRAAQAKTLLVDAGTAQPFRFDPVHEPQKPNQLAHDFQR